MPQSVDAILYVCCYKNLLKCNYYNIRLQEKSFNLNWDSNLGLPDPDLEVRVSNPGSGSNVSLGI